ncbi:MAG TPA: PEP-CTERM sorting domain-containing protein, partial [Janthinobacterium sp.]|nr:PEP-CTERM sorting domain-containing protein [Janthinobacterium sp.]
AVRRGALALLLSACASLAQAGPAYHVEIDTAGFGGPGWLDLQFNPGNMNGVAPASALATHFIGAYDDGGVSGNTPVWSGDVSGSLAGGVHFGNGGSVNDLFHAVNFGGKVAFDLSFSGAASATPNLIQSLFSVAAYGADQSTPL